MIFLDTCALLRKAFEKNKLSSNAISKIESCEISIISSISIWEIGIKIKKGKLKLPISLEKFVSTLQEIDDFKILAIDESTWIDSLNLDWGHRDPADRIIVASAMARDLELVTSDRQIIDFYPKAIW